MDQGANKQHFKESRASLDLPNYDTTNTRIIADPLLNLDKQVHWGTTSIGGRGGLAPCLLHEQVTPRGRDELSFDKASLPCTHFCYTKTKHYFLGYSLNLVNKSTPWGIFYPDQPYRNGSLNGFFNSVSLTRSSPLKEYKAKPCQTCWPSSLPASMNRCMKTCHAKKYVSWRQKNGILSWMAPPLI